MLLVGRSSSHFTRIPRIVADEAGVPLDFQPIYDMTALDASMYAGNPALKLPILKVGTQVVFGAMHIARTIAEHAGRTTDFIWPEEIHNVEARNAQELVWHGMSTQVQLVMGTAVAKLPADNVFFTKARAGFEGALAWLDQHLEGVLNQLPSARLTTLFEVSLFCLIEHLLFRPSVAVSEHPTLIAFAQQFATRASAQRTPYRIDQR